MENELKPILIGKNGRCKCTLYTPCPLGRSLFENRCTEEELREKGQITKKLIQENK